MSYHIGRAVARPVALSCADRFQRSAALRRPTVPTTYYLLRRSS